ncbi:hypothetical protein [Cohnella sp. GbtcB17]|uniref:hypothetical protein n=1 Tax=Cohnella sp. GbtcB17 TaxID=2824762 RepID=UPI001C304967|nr:hypothetical protein [Cohnella sp. GbtcB17]
MKVNNVWQLEADPTQPVAEVGNLIVAYLRAHPGNEVKILTAIRSDVDDALEQFKKKQSPQEETEIEAKE